MPPMIPRCYDRRMPPDESLELFGREIPNSAMMGAFAKVYPGIIPVEPLVAEAGKAFEHLLDADLVEKNLMAIQRGCEETRRT